MSSLACPTTACIPTEIVRLLYQTIIILMQQYAQNSVGRSHWSPEVEDSIDMAFMTRVQNEVTQSCALPFAVPLERIPDIIRQAAQWFWEQVDMSVEERYYIIKNSEICRGSALNKTVQLPPQIVGVFGVHKVQEDLKYGAMGDFSIERMMMSSYSMFGGAGIIGGGLGVTGGTGYSLSDVMVSMLEVDTYDQFLNPPVSFNYNPYSSKLVLLGDVGYSDILIQCWVRCRIQDLYNSYYFFRLCVCFCKRALGVVYGSFEFKLPGGVQINYDQFNSAANDEIEEIKEWAQNNRAADYFFMPGQV